MNTKQKRVKERYVSDAIEMVCLWRKLFQEGRSRSLTLDSAAEIVGVPRKTLENYYYLLKKAETLIDLTQCQNQKMGSLRKLVRSHNQMKQETDKFFLKEEDQIVYDEQFEDAIVTEQNIDQQFHRFEVMQGPPPCELEMKLEDEVIQDE